MKKTFNLIFALNIFAAISCLTSCEMLNDQKDREAQVYLTYTISSNEGQSMYGTKATNAEVFDEFYQKIISGDLVAPSYELTFTEKTTGAIYSVSGNWSSKDMVTLRTGVYHVVGKSTAVGENIQDKCSLVFDDEITVDAQYGLKLDMRFPSISVIKSITNTSGSAYTIASPAVLSINGKWVNQS